MSMFSNWLKKRMINEDDDPTSSFKFNTDDSDYAQDHDKLMTELIKTVLRKYPDETMDFLNTIAGRGDAEVAGLLRKSQRGQGPRLAREPSHPTQAEVVPSTADTGHNPDAGE